MRMDGLLDNVIHIMFLVSCFVLVIRVFSKTSIKNRKTKTLWLVCSVWLLAGKFSRHESPS